MESFEFSRIPSHEFCGNLLFHALGKCRIASEVDRHWQNSAQYTTKKSGHPLGTVFTPQKNAIAFSNSSISERGGEAPCQSGKLRISGAPLAQTLSCDYGNARAVPFEIIDKRTKMRADRGHPFRLRRSCFWAWIIAIARLHHQALFIDGQLDFAKVRVTRWPIGGITQAVLVP